MADRMIECPRCNGLSRNDGTASLSCSRCGSSGTIPDRRKPTNADRAVERIKAYCEGQMTPIGFDADMPQVGVTILRIIREEAERNG